MESKKGGVQGYRETGHSPRELSREGSEPLGCRVRMMHTLSSVVLFSAFLSPSEVPGNGRGVVVVTSLLLLPPHPWHQPHLRDLLRSGDPRPELETPCLQGRSHPGGGGPSVQSSPQLLPYPMNSPPSVLPPSGFVASGSSSIIAAKGCKAESSQRAGSSGWHWGTGPSCLWGDSSAPHSHFSCHPALSCAPCWP